MSKLKNWSAILVLMLTTQSLLAQTAEQATENKPSIPSYILRVGYSPVNPMQSTHFNPGIAIEWEKPLTARLSFTANLFRDLSSSTMDGYDERRFSTNTNRLSDIRTSLSFSINYYLKANAFDGLYVSFRTNNAIAEVVDYHVDLPLGGTVSERGIITKPRRGLYLGYRKVFDSGFFVDGSVGVTQDKYGQFNNKLVQNSMDFKLTLGWQLRWGKKKK